MTRELASSILQRLQIYYPRQYPTTWDDDRCCLFVDDLCEVYAPYNPDSVCQAYKKWHAENTLPPTVADIIKQLQFDSGARLEPIRQKEFEFYIGADGNEYAREKK